jgi:hypothetical protein
MDRSNMSGRVVLVLRRNIRQQRRDILTGLSSYPARLNNTAD